MNVSLLSVASNDETDNVDLDVLVLKALTVVNTSVVNV